MFSRKEHNFPSDINQQMKTTLFSNVDGLKLEELGWAVCILSNFALFCSSAGGSKLKNAVLPTKRLRR